MKILSIPLDFYSEAKRIEEFEDFSLSLTKRSWSGNQYIEEKACSKFIDELAEFKQVYTNVFKQSQELEEPLYLHFSIDSGIFSDMVPWNDKIIEFLEELDDFRTMSKGDANKERNAIKYAKKFKTYIQKTENVPYVLRWLHMNSNHFFYQEFKKIINNQIKDWGVRDRNKADKGLSSMAEKADKKLNNMNREELKKMPLYATKTTNIMGEVLNDKIAPFVESLFKNCFDEPSLMFYGLEALKLYMEQIDTLPNQVTSNRFKNLVVKRNRNKLELSIFNIKKHEFETIVNNESLTTALGSKRNFLVDSSTLRSIDEKMIENHDHLMFEDILEGIKEISEEKLEEIKNDKKIDELINKHFSHHIYHNLFVGTNIEKMTFDYKEEVVGPEGKEQLIVVSVITDEDQIFTFPLIEPKYWEHIPPIQASLTAYAICLMYDYCQEGNSRFIPYEGNSFLQEHYLLLIADPSFDSFKVEAVPLIESV